MNFTNLTFIEALCIIKEHGSMWVRNGEEPFAYSFCGDELWKYPIDKDGHSGTGFHCDSLKVELCLSRERTARAGQFRSIFRKTSKS